MSLFSILYVATSLTPEAIIAASFPGHLVQTERGRSRVETDALDASAAPRPQPNFDVELFGFESTVSIYFTLAKYQSAEARRQLADAVRSLLGSIPGDVAVTYLDTLVLKRVAETAMCAIGFIDMLPHGGAGWTIVPELEQPE